MSIKSTLIKWLLLSEWMEWLKGKKRILGVVSLLLYAAIYVVPELWPELAYISPIAANIAKQLASLGIPLDTTLSGAGIGLTVLGFLDWIAKHIISDGLIKGLKMLERIVVPSKKS